MHDGTSEPSGEATHRVTSRNDAELLRAARRDPDAFREFYARYAVRIRSWFVRHTGSEPAGLDLTAETFAQAWHSPRRLRDLADGSGAPWLFGVARNLLRQYHKHNRIESAARERLELRIVHQLPYDAVAGRLGCSQNAARLRVSRALRALTTQIRSAQA